MQDGSFGRRARGLPTLAAVFTGVLIAGIGLIAWTLTDSGSTTEAPAASARPGNLPPLVSLNVPVSPTAAVVPSPAPPALAPINVDHLKEDIQGRRGIPGAGSIQFTPAKLASLTGSSQPDVVMQWPSGGTCGNFIEVWGYLQGKVANLSPKDGRNGNDFGCGGAEVQDYLGNGRQQLATAARTYDPKQFSGGEYLVRTVWCWTGSEFKTVVSYYENAERQRLRTEAHNPQQICR